MKIENDSTDLDLGQMVGVEAVTGLLGITRRSLERWIADGSFPAAGYRIKGRVLWDRRTVVDWLNAHRSVLSQGE